LRVVARRIQLPSADELFGGEKPSPKKRQTASRRTSSTGKRSTKKSFSPKVGSPDTDSARIDTIEARLASLPIDSLMDLRDGLEDILAADTLDEAAVRELLDSLGA
jgi:hypothetical protein